MPSIVYDRIREPVQYVVDPGAVIKNNTETYGGSRFARLRQAGGLGLFYFANLLLYTLPLTAGGFGTDAAGTPPPAFAALARVAVSDVAAAWAFLQALVTNSLFLLAASVVVFLTFHLGMLLTLSTRGVLQSMHTVAYSTGVYMAGIFTITWTVETTEGVVAADDLLLNLQARFFYVFIDLAGVGLELPSGRPDAVDFGALTTVGQVLIAAEIVAAVYFLYSMYLGARLNHRGSRWESLVAVTFVGISPALYVIGTIIWNVVVLGGT